MLTPQSRVPWAWVLSEVLPEMLPKVLPYMMTPQSRVPWTWLVPEVVPEVVPDGSTAENPKYVSPSSSVSPRPAGQYLPTAPQSRVMCVTMKPARWRER